MKTQHEIEYEKLVVKKIITDCKFLDEIASDLLEFHECSNLYYEKLCDNLYISAIRRSTERMWMTSSGLTYLSDNKKCFDDIELCHATDVPLFEDDLVDQLRFICNQIRKIVA